MNKGWQRRHGDYPQGPTHGHMIDKFTVELANLGKEILDLATQSTFLERLGQHCWRRCLEVEALPRFCGLSVSIDGGMMLPFGLGSACCRVFHFSHESSYIPCR